MEPHDPGDRASGGKTAHIRAAPSLAGRALIRVYRYTLSPLIGFHCRHLPTCSDYADQALARFGLWAGGWMTLARLCRCHPAGTSGLDFVPDRVPSGARWYLPWRYGRWRGTNAVVDHESDDDACRSGGAE
jgi:putative membrane protein insertion efficiency factor